MGGWLAGAGGTGVPGWGPRGLWLDTMVARSDPNSEGGQQQRPPEERFLPGWTARGEERLAGTPRRRLGQSALGRRRFQGAPRRAPRPRALRQALELLRRFPARPGNPARLLLGQPPPSQLLPPPPGAHRPGKTECSACELLALEEMGEKVILQTTPFCGVGYCLSLFLFF